MTGKGGVKAKTRIGGQQTKLFEPAESKSKSTSGLGMSKKLEMKKLAGTKDSDYSSKDESDDERRGGQKLLPLLKYMSKPCHRKGETKKMVRCMGSKGKFKTKKTTNLNLTGK